MEERRSFTDTNGERSTESRKCSIQNELESKDLVGRDSDRKDLDNQDSSGSSPSGLAMENQAGKKKTKKEKAPENCKGKKCNKFWSFLSKKKLSSEERCETEIVDCDDFADDQLEATSVSCLCTGLRRSQVRLKVIQESAATEVGGENVEASFPVTIETADPSALPRNSKLVVLTETTPLPRHMTSGTAENMLISLLQPAGGDSGACSQASVYPHLSYGAAPNCPCPIPDSEFGSATAIGRPSCSSMSLLPSIGALNPEPGNASSLVANGDLLVDCLNCELHTSGRSFIPRTVHTQVDYIHCLVPDLKRITNCSYYWGVMDRYEAERLLDNRPEGTFLLRDSAQEEFLFSVSFRRYSRSLHARVEQWNHRFSFDSHDPSVYASASVCGLVEHYKDPACCMFFEPMLALPLVRPFPFSLQYLCRAVICSMTTYDGITYLPIPKSLHQFLQYYHYKQKVRVRRFESTHSQ